MVKRRFAEPLEDILPSFLKRPKAPTPVRRIVPCDVTSPPRTYRRELRSRYWTSWEVVEISALAFFGGCLLMLCLIPR